MPGADPDSAGRRQLTPKKAFQMKTSTIIRAADLAAVAVQRAAAGYAHARHSQVADC